MKCCFGDAGSACLKTPCQRRLPTRTFTMSCNLMPFQSLTWLPLSPHPWRKSATNSSWNPSTRTMLTWMSILSPLTFTYVLIIFPFLYMLEYQIDARIFWFLFTTFDNFISFVLSFENRIGVLT